MSKRVEDLEELEADLFKDDGDKYGEHIKSKTERKLLVSNTLETR